MVVVCNGADTEDAWDGGVKIEAVDVGELAELEAVCEDEVGGGSWRCGACGVLPATTASSHSVLLSRVFPRDPSLPLALMVDRRIHRRSPSDVHRMC
ncbi:hypothetical protein ACFX2G_035234 [Malus domestica]